MENSMNRRNLLITGAAALSIGSRRILGANDRVRMGLIGLGGRGNAHLGGYLSIPGAQVAALCDVNQAARERANGRVTKAGQEKAVEFGDMRKLFDSKDIDAVSMACVGGDLGDAGGKRHVLREAGQL
jgi:hypothetical protein